MVCLQRARADDELPHLPARDADGVYPVRPATRWEIARKSDVLFDVHDHSFGGAVSVEAVRRILSAVRDTVCGLCVASVYDKRLPRAARGFPTRHRPLPRRRETDRTPVLGDRGEEGFGV